MCRPIPGPHRQSSCVRRLQVPGPGYAPTTLSLSLSLSLSRAYIHPPTVTMRAELFVAVVLALATTEAAEDDYICKTSIEVQYTAPAAGEILGPIVLGTATSTSFWTIFRAFLSSTPPRTRLVLCST